MNKKDEGVEFLQLKEDVLEGLQKKPKSLPSKYFYDEKGSQLFEEICRLEEYYPTRTEISIMEAHIKEIISAIGDEALLIEFGSGSSYKTRMILGHANELTAYVPVDISGDFLLAEAEKLRTEFPGLKIDPVQADYTKAVEIKSYGEQKRVVYFPGSTVGNFTPENARIFLGETAGMLQKGGCLLIGVDSKKSPEVLERAYDDAKGVTAAFNKNLLHRLNRELDATFRTEQFRHEAIYNRQEGRIEMHLVSLKDQTVWVGESEIRFRNGEPIHTENSYKYSAEEFIDLLEDDYRLEKLWTDPNHWFYLFCFSVI
jgi:dimethylhistidine N-methyltransferase